MQCLVCSNHICLIEAVALGDLLWLLSLSYELRELTGICFVHLYRTVEFTSIFTKDLVMTACMKTSTMVLTPPVVMCELLCHSRTR